jgi:hypothetical protein
LANEYSTTRYFSSPQRFPITCADAKTKADLR